jgi:hypothetical protein
MQESLIDKVFKTNANTFDATALALFKYQKNNIAAYRII